jgi:hypothetical protein
MKSIWKWILGILLVLVVVGLFVSLAFMLHGGFARGVDTRGVQEFGQFERGPMMGQGQIYGFGAGPGRMMGGYGFASPFLMVCRFFLRLIPLALLALLVYAAYRFGTHRTNAKVSSAAATTSLAAPDAAVSETSAIKACRKCGSVVQEGWNNCPNCGTKQ